MAEEKSPKLYHALIPILVLIALLGLNVYIWGEDASGGPNQIALLTVAAVTVVIGAVLKISWKKMLDGIVESIGSAMSAIIILMLIGALVGTWLMSGVVPTMVYYGLRILSPEYFLFAACIVSSVVSLATGSSWSTVATVGVALFTIGTFNGIHSGWVAGAIISGAYFGDKMSPLSDTTNLAPAMAGTDLITHIRYMAITTIPSIVISLLVFLFYGLSIDYENNSAEIEQMMGVILENFNITPWLFLVPLAVIFLIIKKVPALPSLFIGALLGGVAAIIFQPELISSISGISGNYFKASYVSVMESMFSGISVDTGDPKVDELFSNSGMYGMMNTIWLILCALTFGGVMYATGLLQRFTRAILVLVHGTGSLILNTAVTCLFFNVTASDQYLAIVVPGKMFKDSYKDFGLKPENLSRTLEDAGTVTSVLVPWNTCGAYMIGILGLGGFMSYAPFCIFNWLSPLMTVFIGFAGWKIRKISKTSDEMTPATV